MDKNLEFANNAKNEDEKLFQMLDNCDEYVILQKSLSLTFSNGFLNLAKARKAGGSYTSATDIRYDIESSIFVEDFIITPSNELTSEEINSNSLLLISALPNQGLRAAQKHFIKSLQTCVALAHKISLINNVILPDKEFINEISDSENNNEANEEE